MRAAVLALLLLALPIRADAQTCTLGPYTSPATAWSTIQAAASGAADGAVLCLRGGNTWSVSSHALSLLTSHANASRLTICTSDATACSDSETKAVVNVSGGGALRFGGNGQGDGYTIRNVVFNGSGGTCSDNADLMAIRTNNGNRDITVDGTTFNGWGHGWMMCNSRSFCGATEENENLVFGTLARPNTVGGCVSNARWWQYGACKNCSFVFDIAGWGGTSGSGGFVHILDFNLWGPTDPDTENVTVEGGTWLLASASTDIGSVIKAAYGKNLIFRDMVVRETQPTSVSGTAPGGIHIEGHSFGTPDIVGWDGAQIYRNVFELGNSGQAVLLSRLGKNIDFFDNIVNNQGTVSPADNGQVIQTATEGQADPAYDPDNVRVYNNAFYLPSNARNWIFSAGAGIGHAWFNNAIRDDRTHGGGQGALGAAILTGSCAQFGTNGANIGPNWIHTPNDPSPSLITGCSAAAAQLPGAPWQTAPGWPDTTPEVGVTSDYGPIANGSNLDNAGVNTGVLLVPVLGDFAGTAFDDADIGIFTDGSEPIGEDVEVVFPVGGEAFTFGQAVTLDADCVGVTNLRWRESFNGGSSYSVIDASEPCGTKAHTIPSTAGPYQIEACDAADNDPCDVQNTPSTIVLETLTVLVPDGGGNYTAGAALVVTWDGSNFTGANVALDYSCNLGGAWVAWSASTPDDGSQSLTLPSCAGGSSQFVARVRDPADSVPIDESDAASFLNLTPAVIFPNGGEVIPEGSAQTLLWNPNQSPGVSFIDADLSLDGCDGPFDTVLAENTPNDGSRLINAMPLIAADEADACLRIGDATDGDPFAVSTAVWTLDNLEAPPVSPGGSTGNALPVLVP